VDNERRPAGDSTAGRLADRLQRSIAALRDPQRGAAERAVTGSLVAAQLASKAGVGRRDGFSVNDAKPVNEIKANPAQKLFEYGIRHESAAPWEGRSTRSGTVTYVADERIEQYVGQQNWIFFDPAELGAFSPALGDQVRIARRGGSVEVERIGPNRLQDGAAVSREARSGMVLFLTSEIEPAGIDSTARAVADRYSASFTGGAEGPSLDFKGGARLHVMPVALDAFDGADEAARVLTQAVAAALRLEVTIRSNRPDAVLEAERALVLCAALFTSEGPAVAIDDTGAIFSAGQLYALGVRNEMRVDTFAFAAAALQRVWSAPERSTSHLQDVRDELTVFSSLAWRADFAFSYLERALEELADAAERSEDPIVPVEGAFCTEEERGEPGTLQPLVRLAYETVELEVAFLGATPTSEGVHPLVGARRDVEALLRGPIQSAVVFTYGNRSAEAKSDRSALEMRRADTLATALAAIFARRGDCVAADAAGSLYDLDELLALALHRRGKAASWTARVAASLAGGPG
jgi:hypothetical protein